MLSVETSTEHSVWKDCHGEEMAYCLHTGDVRAMDTILEKRSYTLAIADIPYGFKAPGSENDDVAFGEKDLDDMLKTFKSMTTAKMWQFVVFHSLQ
jgi:hypothetical protein